MMTPAQATFVRKIPRPLWAALALLLLCLPAIQPFLQGAMPRTDDGNLHIYRSVVLDHSLRSDGWLYPRYSSGLVAGYGAPLFNYFPPTSYSPVVFLHRAGLPFVDAWLATMALLTWLAAGGAYALGRIWVGETGGYLTAAAYVYAPYLLFDTVTRGTSSEVAALAVLPWALWGFTRLAQGGRRLDFALAVLAFTAFIPLHNIITVHGTLFLMAYALLLVVQSEQRLRTLRHLLAAGLFALLLTTFFWLPALAETDFTKIQGVTETLNFVDVTRTLRSLSDVLALPHTADTTQLQQEVPIALGWPQMVLGALGLLAGWRCWRRERTGRLFGVQLFALLSVAVVVVSQLEASAWWWETLPLIGFTQFAWRALGVGSLALALLAGIGGALLLDFLRAESRKMGAFCVLLAIMGFYAMPWLYTPYQALQADSIPDAQDYERRTGELALSSYSEYLPAWNAAPLNLDALTERFVASETIPRLHASADLTLHDAQWGGTWARLELTLDEPQTLVFDWLYVPGWAATLDGDSRLDVVPTSPEGLLSVTLPAGDHTLRIWLERTPLQATAEALSIATVCALAAVLRVRRLWATSDPDRSHTDSVDHRVGAGLRPARNPDWLPLLVGLVGAGLLLTKALWLDRAPTFVHTARFVDGQIAGAEMPKNADFQGGIHLLAVETPEQLAAGMEGQISLFWTLSGSAIDQDYSSLLHLRDAAGTLITETSRFYPGGLATSNWQPGYYLRDTLRLAIPPYTPPGRYTLHAALYDPATGERLSVLNEVGNPVGASLEVAAVRITRPAEPPAAPFDTLAQFGALGLRAQEGLPAQATVGDELTVSLLWSTADTLAEPHTFRLLWQDAAGDISAAAPPLPLVNGFPSTEWQAGDVWRGVHRVVVPGSLERGDYTLLLAVGDEQHAITTMRIRTPERSFDRPTVQQESGAQWRNGIRLVGADWQGEALVLHWQTDALLHENLRLFVQVLGEGEQILALTDGVPVDWTRPTTGWAVGEFLRTTHEFPGVNVAEHPLRIGWYDPDTGERVPLTDSSDALILVPDE